MSIWKQATDALDAATLENGYPHDYSRDPLEQVLEIHDWSGIAGFDVSNGVHRATGVYAVEAWRREHPEQ